MTYNELKEYFSNENNIKDNIKVVPGETIISGKKFIEGTFATLDANSGKKTFIPYFSKLVKYYEIVKELKKEED